MLAAGTAERNHQIFKAALLIVADAGIHKRKDAGEKLMHALLLIEIVDDRSVFTGESLEARFKTLTGKDAPVIDYLNQQESVHQFLASVLSLVDSSISNYQQRGFKNLMVSFGCTGGQHRSVFLAEQLAKRLRARNGLEVAVRHLELEKLGKRKALQ